MISVHWTIFSLKQRDYTATNCEIIWILKCVMSGVSVRFNDDVRQTVSVIFSDINFKDFCLNRTKSKCVINHDLSPYFQTLLTDALGKSEIHVYSFDKSLRQHSGFRNGLVC